MVNPSLGGTPLAGSAPGGTNLNAFEQFRKQAKEKENREKQLRVQQEQVRKQEQRQRMDPVKPPQMSHIKDEHEDKTIPIVPARKHHAFNDLLTQHAKPSNSSPATDSNPPMPTSMNPISERDRQRQLEQERRRKEAVINYI